MEKNVLDVQSLIVRPHVMSPKTTSVFLFNNKHWAWFIFGKVVRLHEQAQ